MCVWVCGLCDRVMHVSYSYAILVMGSFIVNALNFIENYFISLVGILFHVNKYLVPKEKGNKHVIGSREKVKERERAKGRKKGLFRFFAFKKKKRFQFSLECVLIRNFFFLKELN